MIKDYRATLLGVFYVALAIVFRDWEMMYYLTLLYLLMTTYTLDMMQNENYRGSAEG